MIVGACIVIYFMRAFSYVYAKEKLFGWLKNNMLCGPGRNNNKHADLVELAVL